MAFSLRLKTLSSLLFFLAAGVTQALGQDGAVLQITTPASQNAPLVLSQAELQSLPQGRFETSTIWTDGIVTFSGVPLRALFERYDIQGTTVEMVALNDYAVAMPIADIQEDAPLLATHMNGVALSVRDKGPFWIVFPYDRDPKYQTEVVYSQSIWQLNRLNIVD